MTKQKSTKRALLASALSLLLCVSMLVGSTFAWFTDSVTSAGNVIQSGKLDVDLVDEAGNSLENQTLQFVNENGTVLENILWEPGCTYTLQPVTVINQGNLALKYQIVVSGIEGNAKLLEAIEWTVEGAELNGYLLPGKSTDALKITGHMKEEANNDYQGLSAEGISITVYATQYTYESDSFNDQYDAAAPWTGIIPDEIPKSLVIVPGGGTQTGTITVKSPEALVYLNSLAKNWVATYSNGQGTSVTYYRESNGGKGTDYYYHWKWDIELAADLDMSNIPMDSVDISYWDSFDGNGHSISNVVLKDGQDGLFNNGAKAINNLTVKNITVNAPEAQTVGAVAGNGNMTNVHVVNATVNGGKYVGGICGKGSSFINCSIKDSTVTGTDKTVGGLVGYSIGDPNPATVSGNLVENVTVTGTYNVGGLLGQSQNETVEGNTVKNVTVKSTLELPTDASSNEVRTAKLAARSNFATTTIGANTVENVTVINVANVAAGTALSTVLPNGGTSEVVLADGNYSLPSVNNGDVTISGDKNTVITVDKPNYTGSDVTFNGVTVKGSGYATGVQHVNTVTYNNATIVGVMCLYGEKVVFNNCTFDLTAVTDYIWTYGAKEVEFNNCTFNTNGKAILVYNEGANLVTKVSVKGCVFNATQTALASGNPAAAIEIDSSLATNGHYTLVTENNTVDSDFAGEWRIKKSGTDNTTVNGTVYNAVTIDGKSVTY